MICIGQSIGASLKSIPDHRSKEFVKVKIQEFIFQAQFGLLATPQAPQTSFQMQPVQYQRPLPSPVYGTPSPGAGVQDNASAIFLKLRNKNINYLQIDVF